MSIATTIVTAREALPAFRPIARSRSKREDAVAMVKRNLSHYNEMVKMEARAVRDKDLTKATLARRGAVGDLLWARALIEQALWLETGGRMGSQMATPNETLRTLPIRGASFTDDND